MRIRDWVAMVAGGAALVASVFAIGGAFRWGQALVAGLVGTALAVQVPSRRRLERISPLVIALGVPLVMTLISLVPVPSFVREALDPTGAELRADGCSLLDLSPWPGLTHDAPGSLRAAIFFLTLLGVAVLSLRMSPSERGRYRVVTAVTVVCAATALVTCAHELVGATRLYGVYEMHARPTVLGPLLNENHLGCLMAIGTCSAIGLVLYARQTTWRRIVWMAVVFLCGGMTVASHSRGATIGLLGGALVTGGLILGQKFASSPHRRNARFATSSLPIGIVAICAVVLVIYSSGGSVSSELGRTTLEETHLTRSKFMAWRSAETILHESPWVGVGRGGFESTFTRVHPASGAATFQYLENEYIQAAVDWGLPGAALIGIALLWFGNAAVRRWRDGPLPAAALGALTAVAMQANVDFGIELLGLAVPVTALAATLSYVPLREESGDRLRWARLSRLLHASVLLIGVGLLFSRVTTSLSEDHDHLAHQAVTMVEVRAELERHPFDYLGFSVAARLTERASDSQSIQLLNHAMRLHPTHPDLHRIAARKLAAAGHTEQAAIEYSAAVRSSKEPEKLIGELAAVFPANQAASAIPIDANNIDNVVDTLRSMHKEPIAAAWLAKVLEIHPHNVHACNRLYDLSLEMGDLKSAELAGRDCVELMPDHQTRLALANVLFQKQGYAEVAHLLSDVETWTGLVEEKSGAWLMLCDAKLKQGEVEDAASCLHHLDVLIGLTQAQHDDIAKRLQLARQPP